MLVVLNIHGFGWRRTRLCDSPRGEAFGSIFVCSRVKGGQSGGSLLCGLVIFVEDSPILGYSDGADPKQQFVFIVTAQELDVVRLLLDARML